MKTSVARRLDPEPENSTPESFIEEIQRIIEAGTLKGTREIAARGLELYPDHLELRRLHHVLRPFEVRVVPGYNSFDPRPNYDWFKKNAKDYRGKWVGLYMGELVAAADTLEEVIYALRDRDPRGSLIHHIH